MVSIVTVQNYTYNANPAEGAVFPWAGAVHDADGWWDPSDPTKLFVPGDIAFVEANFAMNFAINQFVYSSLVRLQLNNDRIIGPDVVALYKRHYGASFTNNNICLLAPVVSVGSGDYFSLQTFDNNSQGIDGNSVTPWMTLRGYTADEYSGCCVYAYNNEISPAPRTYSPGFAGGTQYYNTGKPSPFPVPKADLIWTTMLWDAIEHDNTGGMWDESDPSKMTVPAGATHIRMNTQVEVCQSGAATSQYTAAIALRILKNGTTEAWFTQIGWDTSIAGYDQRLHQLVTPLLECVPGDYFEVQVSTFDYGGSLISVEPGRSSWFHAQVFSNPT